LCDLRDAAVLRLIEGQERGGGSKKAKVGKSAARGVPPSSDSAARGSVEAGGAPEASSSAKVAEVVRLIGDLREADGGAKAVVFSQFPRALVAVRAALAAAGLDAMHGAEEAAAFAQVDTCAALLLDLRVASVGLNLVMASHVFLLEPSTNPALESQAIARCHRMGQTRTVHVTSLIYDGTLERRLLQCIHDGPGRGLEERARSEVHEGLLQKLFL